MAVEGPHNLDHSELRVLVVPPTRADAAAMSRLFKVSQIDAEFFHDMRALCSALAEGAGLVILSEEALVAEIDRLAGLLGGQPVWSDVPIIVLSRAGAESVQLGEALLRVGNASVVERPVRVTTLISLIRSCLRARERQYQLRSQLIERERATHVIREGERRYRLLVENISDYAIFTIDVHGNVSGWNDGAEQILGYSADEIMGKSASIVFTPEDRASGVPQQEIATAIANGRATDVRWHIRKDGSRLFVDGAMTAVRDDDGKLIGFSKVMKDITQQHYIELERERLFESERQARAEAEHAGRMKDEFLATLSHELRTPLNAMLGWSQLLRSTPGLPEDVGEGLTIIERNARSQAQIIEDLLDMSRIISGKVQIHVQNADLVSLLKSAIETVRPAAHARGVELAQRADRAECVIAVDPSRIQQVFWNLLTNAVKFTSRGGRVTVSLDCNDTEVRVSVADTGEGIDPAFLPHVFDRFRQADASTTREHGGLGLGLSIVKQLVELHGGTITAASEGAGRGAVFTVMLPCTADSAADQTSNEPARNKRADANGVVCPGADVCDLHSVNILAVDDEPDARALMQRILENAGATVSTAASVPEAIDILIRRLPHILISDIGMPEEDGYALIRRVRSLAEDKGGAVPAIALTAYARSEDRETAKTAGFQVHLAKPVEPRELIATIAGLLRR